MVQNEPQDRAMTIKKKKKRKKSILGHFGTILPNFGRLGAIFEGSKIEKNSKNFFLMESIQNDLKRILDWKSR